MKNVLSLGALVGVALLAFAGCGDDPAAPIELNTYFELKKGDTFTYERHERDMDNQRVASSRTVHKWVVLETNLSHENRTGVTKLVQINFDSSGTIESATRDTFYIRSGIDGLVHMNVISSTMARIPTAAPFASQIPFTWVQVTDMKTSAPMRYSAIAGGSVVTDVTMPGLGLPGRIVVTDTAFHKGKVAATVNGVAYPNAFHTDHTMKMVATLTATGSRIIDNDSLHMSYDFDVNSGLLRQVMESDSITATIPTQGTRTEAVNGFELTLISAVRAK